MKILFISTEIWSEYNPEGIVAKKILNGLVENDYDVDVITVRDFDYQHTTVIPNRTPELIEKIGKILFGVEKIAFIVGVLRYMDQINVADYDVLITRSEPVSIHLIGVLMNKNIKIKRIAMFSDVGYLNPYYGWKSWLKKGVSYLMEKKIFSSYDQVTHTNRFVIKQYVEHGFPENKMQVFPNPLEIIKSTQKKQEKKTINNEIKLAYIGSLYGGRSPFKLFEYLQNQNENFHLFLIGAVRNMYYEGRFGKVGDYLKKKEISNLLYMIKKYNLEEKVFILPFMPKEKLKQYVDEHIDILVNIDAPSEENLFLSSKIVDYLQYDLPILNISSPGATVDFLGSVGVEKYIDYKKPFRVSLTDIVESGDFVPKKDRINQYLSKNVCLKLINDFGVE